MEVQPAPEEDENFQANIDEAIEQADRVRLIDHSKSAEPASLRFNPRPRRWPEAGE
jgi:oligoribonuclease NrnB/cAMP/cGMP phosphodiesterase (DHH superfamily)